MWKQLPRPNGGKQHRAFLIGAASNSVRITPASAVVMTTAKRRVIDILLGGICVLGHSERVIRIETNHVWIVVAA